MSNGTIRGALADQIRAASQESMIVELLSGTVIKRDLPDETHERYVDRIYERLSAHIDMGDLGAVFRLPWPLELSKFDVVRPDVYFTSLEAAAVEADGVKGTPELVVEVLSDDTREQDRGEKLRLYLWAGVFEYWIVDPFNRTFEGLTKGKISYEPISVAGSTFRSVLLPGFELDLDWLFQGLEPANPA